MDDVICEGDEQSLTQCRFPGWGISDCNPDEVAGVICHNNEIMDLTKKDIRKPIQDSMKSVKNKFRLTGGKGDHEGRIEVGNNGKEYFHFYFLAVGIYIFILIITQLCIEP